MYEQLEVRKKNEVREVSQLLHGQYAILTGGKSNGGCPIITFPDNANFQHLTDDEYKKLMVYLTSIPSLEDSDLGFVLIVDRRKDKWNAVKMVLMKIAWFFPSAINVAYIIRPEGFFQKALSEVSNKFFREEFQFKVVICNCEIELHSYIDKSQLTENLGGYIHYDHHEWIEQRVAVEKFSASTQDISSALRCFTQKLQGTEMPNDATSCELLLRNQRAEYDFLKSDLSSASKSGESLLNCIRCKGDSWSVSHLPDKLINVTAIERLLVQLEETEKTFNAFWMRHESKLTQNLHLRRFEAEFKELQPVLEEALLKLSSMTETGDSVMGIDDLLLDLHHHHDSNLEYFRRANDLQITASQMIEDDHYAVDSIRPKCIELIRMKEKFQDTFDERLQSLQKRRKLQEKLERVNHWCTKGVELLASQQIERYQSHKLAEECLVELENFLCSPDSSIINTFKEMNLASEKSVPAEVKALAHQVLRRVEDVTMMCEKRKISLKKLTTRLPRPIHAVTPEPAIPMQCVFPLTSPSGSASYGSSINYGWSSINHNANETTKFAYSFAPHMKISPTQRHGSNDISNVTEALKAKRGHILKELLETERVYVTELRSILKGYKDEMLNPDMLIHIPISLHNESDILFGNMEDIFRFHNDVFLRDLESCIETPEMIGLCFVHRKEIFHNLYSFYCQNKPRSEELRRRVGDANAFFKECQKKLGHKLPLGAYLLKPVQRITKYQLLLKDLLECTPESKGRRELEDAVETMLNVLKFLNDSMHQVSITGFPGNLAEMGKLLMQGSFCVWNEKKSLKDLRLKPAQRHLFLYEKILVFTKRSSGKSTNKQQYQFKNSLKMSEIGLTENIKGDAKKFEVWLPGRQEVYTILPRSSEIKEMWVKEIKKVLLDQFEYLKGENIKQYSFKLQKGSSFNDSFTTPLSPTSQRSDSVTSFGSDGSKTMTSCTSRSDETVKSKSSVASSEGGQTATTLGGENFDELNWSSDYSQSEDDEDVIGDRALCCEDSEPLTSSHFVVLADYNAMSSSEVTLREGEHLDLIKVGCGGWWYVKVLGSPFEGWAPAAYLERVRNRKDSRSSPSLCSIDSSSGIRHTNSRSSMHFMSNRSEDVLH